MAIQSNPYVEKRRVVIALEDSPMTQSTPMMDKNKNWIVKVEPLGFYRSANMFWGRTTNDPFCHWSFRDELAFSNLEQAVRYVQRLGWAYDVVYPKERYHQFKSYAENFTFKKETASDLEEDEELF